MSSENNLRLVCQLGEGCEMSQILASPRPPTGFPLGAMHDRHSGSSSKVTRTRRVTRDIRALGDEIATERATTAYISTVSSDSPLSIPSVSRKPLFNSTENARNPMCTTSLSMTAINQRLDAPSEFYQSPSSVSDMEVNQDAPVKRRKVCDDYGVATGEERVQSASSTSPASAAGDTQPLSSDGERALASGASVADINADVSPPITASPTSRKRRKFSDTREDAGQDEDVKEPQEQSCRESLSGSMDGASKTADDDDDGNRSPDIECSALDAKRRSRRTLYIEYWSRTDECKERKWDHLDEINDKYGAAEEHIFATTLNGIEHWTLWHVNELNHEQIKQYVENWIDANAPHVERWNYDDNPERSIDIFHVHVYLQVGEDMSVLQGREVEDLMHELD